MRALGHGADTIRFPHSQLCAAGNSLTNLSATVRVDRTSRAFNRHFPIIPHPIADDGKPDAQARLLACPTDARAAFVRADGAQHRHRRVAPATAAGTSSAPPRRALGSAARRGVGAWLGPGRGRLPPCRSMPRLARAPCLSGLGDGLRVDSLGCSLFLC